MKTIMNLSNLLLVTGVLLFTACTKENKNSTTTLNVRLTDAPADYAEVNIDIREIRVKFSDEQSDSGWQTLKTNAGIYNLLDFQNEKDTLLASGQVTQNSVQQIRAILGSDNSIKVGNVVYPLTIPSGSESGLKLMVNKRLNMSLETIVLDFDALLSIQEEDGKFMLRPVLKLK